MIFADFSARSQAPVHYFKKPIKVISPIAIRPPSVSPAPAPVPPKAPPSSASSYVDPGALALQVQKASVHARAAASAAQMAQHYANISRLASAGTAAAQARAAADNAMKAYMQAQTAAKASDLPGATSAANDALSFSAQARQYADSAYAAANTVIRNLREQGS